VLLLPVAVCAVVAGALAATAGTVAHQAVLGVADLRLPVGAVLALALTALVQVALVAASPPTPVGALVPVGGVVGWAAVLWAGLSTGPGGDRLVPVNGRGAAWALGGLGVLVVATVAARRVLSR
jgi:hypothetical protein